MLINIQYLKESVAGLLLDWEEGMVLEEPPYTFCVRYIDQDAPLDLANENSIISINQTGIDSTFGKHVRKDEANPVLRFIIGAMSEEIPNHMSAWLQSVFITTDYKYYPGMPGQKLIFARPRKYTPSYRNSQHNYYYCGLDVEFRIKGYNNMNTLTSF